MAKKEVALKEESHEVSLSVKEAFSLVPKTMAEAIELSKLIAESDLAPKDYKGKAGNVLIAVQMGSEIGVSPMQSIQNIAVINGRPSIFGDLGKALLLSKGCRIEERDIKEIKRCGEAWCKVTRPDGATPTIRTFSIDNARDAKLWGKDGPWSTTPYRMLAWRAFWFAARDGAADFLRGLSGAEEVRDYDTTAVSEAATVPEIAEPQRASDMAKAQDAELSQDAPATTGKPARDPNWRPMESKYDSSCESCPDDIVIGDKIYYDPKTKKAYHQEHFAS